MNKKSISINRLIPYYCIELRFHKKRYEPLNEFEIRILLMIFYYQELDIGRLKLKEGLKKIYNIREHLYPIVQTILKKLIKSQTIALQEEDILDKKIMFLFSKLNDQIKKRLAEEKFFKLSHENIVNNIQFYMPCVKGFDFEKQLHVKNINNNDDYCSNISYDNGELIDRGECLDRSFNENIETYIKQEVITKEIIAYCDKKINLEINITTNEIEAKGKLDESYLQYLKDTSKEASIIPFLTKIWSAAELCGEKNDSAIFYDNNYKTDIETKWGKTKIINSEIFKIYTLEKEFNFLEEKIKINVPFKQQLSNQEVFDSDFLISLVNNFQNEIKRLNNFTKIKSFIINKINEWNIECYRDFIIQNSDKSYIKQNSKWLQLVFEQDVQLIKSYILGCFSKKEHLKLKNNLEISRKFGIKEGAFLNIFPPEAKGNFNFLENTKNYAIFKNAPSKEEIRDFVKNIYEIEIYYLKNKNEKNKLTVPYIRQILEFLTRDYRSKNAKEDNSLYKKIDKFSKEWNLTDKLKEELHKARQWANEKVHLQKRKVIELKLQFFLRTVFKLLMKIFNESKKRSFDLSIYSKEDHLAHYKLIS